MIKAKVTEAADLRDIRILGGFDEELPAEDALEELGYDAVRGAFQARRVA
ncbi:hypothetical protein AB0D08_00330 [Kitasatospora sp. NPDC048540]